MVKTIVKTIEPYYYNTETGVPMKTSVFTLLLNLILRFMYKTLKAAHSAAQKIFPAGIDNKKITHEEEE